MADGEQTIEELTCAICMESLRDAVQLPCQHSYCSSCITKFADKSKPEDTSDSAENDWTIACPMCRAPTKLWREGMVCFSSLAESVEKVESEVKVEGCAELCSLCEEDDAKEAVKFCPDCESFYCEDCLAHHPIRGKFKHHQLVAAQEYILQMHKESPEKTEDKDLELCTAHKKALILYCGACRRLCCLDCMADHCEHPMSDKLSAYRKLKEPCVQKTEECEALEDQLASFFAEMEDFLSDVEKNEDGQRKEIEKAYQRDLEAINNWRRRALERVDQSHSYPTSHVKSAIGGLRLQMLEMEKIIRESGDLPCSLTETFLQMSRELTSRMGKQLVTAKTYMEEQRESKKKLELRLKENPVSPVYHMVGLKTIAVTKMKFNETSDTSLVILDSGSTVRFEDRFDKWCCAWTDGCLKTGCHYWELKLTLHTSSGGFKDARYICRTGVTEKGCSLDDEAGDECWWVAISKRNSMFRFSCSTQSGKVEDAYRNWSSVRTVQTIGFCLECNTRRLTFVDCERNAVILRLYNLGVGRPLVPAVDFRGKRVQSASACLLTGDSVSPPSVLWSTS